MINLKPDYYVKSLFEIPIKDLQEKGIQGIIIDLDNTLTQWNCADIDKEICFWLNDLIQKGFKLCIVSNNNSKRIKASIDHLGIPFISNAWKPSKRGFIRALTILKTSPKATVIIGDQMFTDILGGKRVGLMTVLVPPLSSKEFLGTKIVRRIEKLILSKLQ